MKISRAAAGLLLWGTFGLAVSGCVSRQASPVPSVFTTAGHAAKAKDAAPTGMCPIYGGFGALSYCYDFDETSGTTLLDNSAAGHNGTISASGVSYGAAGLATNSFAAESTDGVTGTMTSGFSPASGSFSTSFFVSLHANANNFPRLVATGNPAHTTPQNGWNVAINNVTTNTVYVNIGYGTGYLAFGYIPLALNTPANVTLTYDATSNAVTLCVGTASPPKCVSKTLPAAYVASGNPVVFGGGSKYIPADATFDEAGYWQGTVLTSTQIATLAGFAGAGATPSPTPVSTASASPSPSPAPSGSPQGMCAIYAASGSPSYCYDFDEASGTTLLDGSGAGHNGTISATGVSYRVAGLATNSLAAETTDGVTGTMTSGFSPASGSFSTSFFVSLHANTDNLPRLIATGNPAHTTPANGWNIAINNIATNTVYANIGYGSGNLAFGYIPLALNTPANVTLTYNASGNAATLCVGTASPPKCVSKTLPAAYVASGNPVVFGGGTVYLPANATFDEAAYWQGTVLTSTQIATLAGLAGAGPPPPTPTPLPTSPPTSPPTAPPTPVPTPVGTPAFNNWPTYGFDNAHDGFNPNSSAITPASLAKLHLAWETTLPNHDFNTQTQPILATNVGSHAGILVVGGTLGSAYGFDALTGAQVWATPLGSASYSCRGNQVSVGVGGSAVYDPSSGNVYVSNDSNSSANAPTQLFINQLSVATGALQSRVNVTPNLLPGELNFTHTSLTLAGGTIYAGTGSTCDISPWRGSIVAVNAGAMSLSNTLYTVWNQAQAPAGQTQPFSGGGVWGWGGVSIDPGGDVWASVGNLDTTSGASGPQTPFVQHTNEFDAFGEHLLQSTPDLSNVLQSNYPGFTFGGVSVDLDLTGTPVLAHPLGCDVAAAVQGKSGYLYLYDTTNLAAGPVNAYVFTPSSFRGINQGNPAFSPLTGLFYAAVASAVAGGVEPAPGMVAIQACNGVSSIAWSAAFGPDSTVANAPRGAPTVTAGGVVLTASPCLLDGNGGCTGTTGSYGGALWALDASSGALLNGGNPIITTPSAIRMGTVVDGDWVYLYDMNGDLYGFTLDPNFLAIQDKFRRAKRLQRPSPWR